MKMTLMRDRLTNRTPNAQRARCDAISGDGGKLGLSGAKEFPGLCLLLLDPSSYILPNFKDFLCDGWLLLHK